MRKLDNALKLIEIILCASFIAILFSEGFYLSTSITIIMLLEGVALSVAMFLNMYKTSNFRTTVITDLFLLGLIIAAYLTQEDIPWWIAIIIPCAMIDYIRFFIQLKESRPSHDHVVATSQNTFSTILLLLKAIIMVGVVASTLISYNSQIGLAYIGAIVYIILIITNAVLAIKDRNTIYSEIIMKEFHNGISTDIIFLAMSGYMMVCIDSGINYIWMAVMSAVLIDIISNLALRPKKIIHNIF